MSFRRRRGEVSLPRRGPGRAAPQVNPEHNVDSLSFSARPSVRREEAARGPSTPESFAVAQRLQRRSEQRERAKRERLESFQDRTRRRVERRAREERRREADRKATLRDKVRALLAASEQRIEEVRARGDASSAPGGRALGEEAAHAASRLMAGRAFLASFASGGRREEEEEEEEEGDESEHEEEEDGGGEARRRTRDESLPSWDRGVRPDQRMTRGEERRLTRALRTFEMYHARKAVSLSRTGAAWAPPAQRQEW